MKAERKVKSFVLGKLVISLLKSDGFRFLEDVVFARSIGSMVEER